MVKDEAGLASSNHSGPGLGWELNLPAQELSSNAPVRAYNPGLSGHYRLQRLFSYADYLPAEGVELSIVIHGGRPWTLLPSQP